MSEQELRQETCEIAKLFRNEEVLDEEILSRIKAMPEVIHEKLPSTANLFLESVLEDRLEITKVLVGMGTDIHLQCKPSLISGNALNVAHSPEQADYLLSLGIEIEKNLVLRESFVNPAIMAVKHNDKKMMLYWLNKQKVLFSQEKEFLDALINETIYQVTIMNQYDMLACIIADDELYYVLKEIYTKEDDMQSIKLQLSSLRKITEEGLEEKKKELKKILNETKKNLSM
ncbi:MAG: hypothetical protein IJA34_14240 [Lachnospiraceae bacterium]|nr:hypothetical protein [Lachnospiraceae bacterium]